MVEFVPKPGVSGSNNSAPTPSVSPLAIDKTAGKRKLSQREIEDQAQSEGLRNAPAELPIIRMNDIARSSNLDAIRRQLKRYLPGLNDIDTLAIYEEKFEVGSGYAAETDSLVPLDSPYRCVYAEKIKYSFIKPLPLQKYGNYNCSQKDDEDADDSETAEEAVLRDITLQANASSVPWWDLYRDYFLHRTHR